MWRYSALLGGGAGGGSVPTLPTYTMGSFGLSAAAVAVTSSASVNTKGAYSASLGTLTQAVDELELTYNSANNGTRSVNLDIQINDTTIIVADLPLFFTANAAGRVRIPVRIAAGSNVKLRTAGSVGSVALNFIGYGLVSDPADTTSLAEPIAPVAATVATNGVALSAGAGWTQLNAAPTANAYKRLIPHIGNNAITSGRAVANYTLEFATGGSGAQVSLGAILQANSTGTQLATNDARLPTLPVAIPAGSTLWARLTASAGADANICNVQLHGVR